MAVSMFNVQSTAKVIKAKQKSSEHKQKFDSLVITSLVGIGLGKNKVE